MDYEKIKEKLFEIQEMMHEIPEDCKGNSEDARCNRRKYVAVKSMVRDNKILAIMERKETIGVIKKNYPHCAESGTQFETALRTLIPELQESEDERTKKDIIQFVKSRLAGFPECEMFVNWLEKQGEQKSVDKIEPKFKVGDWIKHNKANFIFQINKVTANKYEFNNLDGYNHSLSIKSVDKKYHLWTIQDAKDGDVLLSPATRLSKESPFIFKEIDKNGIVRYHAALLQSENFRIADGITNVMGYANAMYHIPASKKQCDLLFSKMKEAGYEWDADKKELKKIENQGQVKESDIPQHENKTCKENDDSLTGWKLPIKWTQDNIDDLTEFEAAMMHVGESFFGEYAGLNPNDTMSVKVEAKLLLELAKPKWTEEDEEMCQETIDWFEKKCFPYALEHENPARECIDWLKSLKHRKEGK